MELKDIASFISVVPRDPLEGTVQRLYHYMPIHQNMPKHWKDVLVNAHLKLSRATDFNDIFDCSGVCVGRFSNEAMRKHLLKISNSLAVNLTDAQLEVLSVEASDMFKKDFLKQEPFSLQEIVCFSAPTTEDSDILMWSHYANKWRGVRLGFDMLFENHEQLDYGNNTPYYLDRVRYNEERASFDLSQVKDIDDLLEYWAWYRSIVVNKAKAWQYENEWRLMAIEGKSEEIGALRFWRFDCRILKSVDIGPRVSASDKKEILNIVAALYPKVEVREVVPDSRLFKIDYTRIR